jgi:hypothetical protein
VIKLTTYTFRLGQHLPTRAQQRLRALRDPLHQCAARTVARGAAPDRAAGGLPRRRVHNTRDAGVL